MSLSIGGSFLHADVLFFLQAVSPLLLDVLKGEAQEEWTRNMGNQPPIVLQKKRLRLQ